MTWAQRFIISTAPAKILTSLTPLHPPNNTPIPTIPIQPTPWREHPDGQTKYHYTLMVTRDAPKIYFGQIPNGQMLEVNFLPKLNLKSKLNITIRRETSGIQEQI